MDRGVAMVFLNGSILGIHRRPKRLVKEFRRLRRAGRVGEFVSIFLQQDSVYIASDGGRVCRPLIICDRGVPRVTSAHTAKVRLPFLYFLRLTYLYRCPQFLAFCWQSPLNDRALLVLLGFNLSLRVLYFSHILLAWTLNV